MICPACHFQGDVLACPVCTERRSREGYLNQQKLFLPAVHGGRMDVVLVRRGQSGPQHIQLMGEPSRTFCWAYLEPPQRRQHVRWSQLRRPDLCTVCLQAFDRLSAEAVSHEQV